MAREGAVGSYGSHGKRARWQPWHGGVELWQPWQGKRMVSLAGGVDASHGMGRLRPIHEHHGGHYRLGLQGPELRVHGDYGSAMQGHTSGPWSGAWRCRGGQYRLVPVRPVQGKAPCGLMGLLVEVLVVVVVGLGSGSRSQSESR